MKFIFKQYILGVSIFAGGLFFSQSTSFAKQYPQMYENQVSNNLPTSTVTEKNLLTPKELMDINLNTLRSDPVLRNANWGFALYDPKTKKMITAHNESESYIPASTTKLLTTETAMNLLGGNFSWLTQLEYSGEIDEEGILNGNLYIVGSGDPSLGTGKAGAATYGEIISDFISKLNEGRGIKKVNGDIIIQNAFFKINKGSELPENIVWMENNNYYLPVGTTKDIDPRQEKLITKSNSPFNHEEKKYFYVSPYIKKMVFADQFSGAAFTTNLPDAPFYLANSLRTNMIKRGIPVTGKVVAKTVDANPEPRKLITAYKSPTLAQIIYDTNQRSDNALAEALLRMVGFQKKGDQTLESGRSVVVEHLGKSGFDLAGLSYYDGSGLSRSNKVTPISQVKFLTSLMESDYYKDFFNSLPVGGQSGTLQKMFYGTGNGRVFAKTGTLNKVKTLAGYIKTNSGKTLVFSILVNNYAGSVSQVKSKIEEILEPAFGL